MFRRRDRQPLWERVRGHVWPRRGWRRAGQYLWLRLTRLPDPPHRIARGVFAGVFVSFTPLFGLHLGLGAALGWLLRGNMVAAMLATLVGNPLTFPPIAVIAMQLGHLIEGSPAGRLPPERILTAFAQASGEIWANFLAMFTAAPAHWDKLISFWDSFFLPYLAGGTVLGITAGLVAYYITLPMVAAYQRLREKRRADRRRAMARRDGLGRDAAP